jgi:hypothetical protein
MEIFTPQTSDAKKLSLHGNRCRRRRVCRLSDIDITNIAALFKCANERNPEAANSAGFSLSSVR